MFNVFASHTANGLWHEIVDAFTEEQQTALVHQQPSRAGATREILHAALSVADPRQRWISDRQPPINPAFAIAEVVWIVTGRNDAAFLNYFNRHLSQYCGPGDSYDGAYGYRLRHHLGVDQLHSAYQALKSNPESRQVVLQVWDSVADLPKTGGKARSADIPCNVVSLLKIRGDRLEWTQVMRSNDIFRGLPYNLVQWTTLQEVMAGWLGLQLGSYNQLSDSLHVYEDSLAYIHDDSSRSDIPNTDRLALPYEESQRVFGYIASVVENLIAEDRPTETLVDLVADADVSEAYKNWLCLLCAESARRRQDIAVTNAIMSHCSNEMLAILFQNWMNRFGSSK